MRQPVSQRSFPVNIVVFYDSFWRSWIATGGFREATVLEDVALFGCRAVFLGSKGDDFWLLGERRKTKSWAFQRKSQVKSGGVVFSWGCSSLFTGSNDDIFGCRCLRMRGRVSRLALVTMGELPHEPFKIKGLGRCGNSVSFKVNSRLPHLSHWFPFVL